MKRARWEGSFASETTDRVLLDPGALHHLVDVLRARAGEVCLLVDEAGRAETAELQREGDQWFAMRLQGVEREGEPPFAMHLIQALPRGEKADFVVQKAVELGATQVHFLESKRSQVRFKWEQYAHKRARWEKIASAAALQCGRRVVPSICVEHSMEDLYEEIQMESGHLCLAYEDEQTLQLKTYLRSLNPKQITSLWCAVGPEGGWAKDEVECWKQMGAVSVLLGPRILRTETAGLALLAAVAYEFSADV